MGMSRIFEGHVKRIQMTKGDDTTNITIHPLNSNEPLVIHGKISDISIHDAKSVAEKPFSNEYPYGYFSLSSPYIVDYASFENVYLIIDKYKSTSRLSVMVFFNWVD